ncbi:MAG TPA: carboxypeptidase-like regulatory domain-containing protein [Gemmatimonadaceae bacterium]
MMQLFRRSLFGLIALAALAPSPGGAQSTSTVRGRVVDSRTNTPIQSAQVSVEGTQLGASTDAEGTFSIAGVPSGSRTIVARRIGYTLQRKQVTVGAGVNDVSFSLDQTANTLEQVVVTGTAAPTTVRALGTSIASVDNSQIAEARSVTVDQALQGKVAGAQITQNSGSPGGGGLSVRLRGTGSIISGSEPLYIVDGVIVDNSSDQLIDFGARSNVQNRLADLDPNDIDRIEIVRGAAAAALYGSRANNGVVQIFTKRGVSGAPRITFGTRYTSEHLAKRLDLNMAPLDAAGKPVTRYDYQDEIFRTGNLKEMNISAEGGGDRTTYYAGASYSGEEGIIKASSAIRRSARVNLSQKVFDPLKLNIGANYVRSEAEFEPNGESGTGVITALLFTPTTFSFFPVNGIYPQAPTGAGFANPLAVIDTWKAPQVTDRFIGSINANYNPSDKFLAQYTLGYDGYQLEADQLIPRGTIASEPTGRSTAVLRNSRIVNNDGVATYTARPSGDLELGSSLGFNYTTQFISTTTAVARDLLPTGELVSAGAIPSAAQSRFNLVTLGFYGQQTMSWRDRLYLTAALRRDASSTFGKGDRWQWYPKLSASYVISDEPWFSGSGVGRFFSSMRLRSALGYAGNQPSIANAYASLDTYVKRVNNDHVGVVNSLVLGNDSLRPERQREFEIGADMGFWNDRINLEATVYSKKVTDALLSRPLPASSGYTTKLDNIGEISNKGFELLARTTNVSSPSLRWTSTITYSRNRNKLDKLLGAPFTLGYANRVEQGQPIGYFYSELPEFNADGSVKLDAAGLIVRSPVATRVSGKVGDPNPKWLGSFLNEIQIGKRIQFRALLDGSFGGDVLNFTKRTLDTFGTSAEAALEFLPASDPKHVAPGYARSKRFFYGFYAEDGTYVKLREVSLTYDLAPNLARAVKAAGLALTVSGRNLHTWTDYTGFDPEMNLFGQLTVERGNDFGTYPIPRQFSIGIRATY